MVNCLHRRTLLLKQRNVRHGKGVIVDSTRLVLHTLCVVSATSLKKSAWTKKEKSASLILPAPQTSSVYLMACGKRNFDWTSRVHVRYLRPSQGQRTNLLSTLHRYSTSNTIKMLDILWKIDFPCRWSNPPLLFGCQPSHLSAIFWKGHVNVFEQTLSHDWKWHKWSVCCSSCQTAFWCYTQ